VIRFEPETKDLKAQTNKNLRTSHKIPIRTLFLLFSFMFSVYRCTDLSFLDPDPTFLFILDPVPDSDPDPWPGAEPPASPSIESYINRAAFDYF
jgi:hypothetical protein